MTDELRQERFRLRQEMRRTIALMIDGPRPGEYVELPDNMTHFRLYNPVDWMGRMPHELMESEPIHIEITTLRVESMVCFNSDKSSSKRWFLVDPNNCPRDRTANYIVSRLVQIAVDHDKARKAIPYFDERMEKGW